MAQHNLRRRNGIFLRFAFFIAALHAGALLAQQSQQPNPADVAAAQGKIANVKVALDKGNTALNAAKSYTDELVTLTDPASNRGDLVMRAQAIKQELTTIVTANPLKDLADRSGAITKASSDLPACDQAALGPDVAQQCTNAAADATSRVADLESAKSALNDALAGVIPFLTAGVNDLGQGLTQLETKWSASDDLSAEDFAASVPDYTRACSASTGVLKETKTPGIYDQLKALQQAIDPANNSLKTALDSLAGKLKSDATKVDSILTAIKTKTDAAKDKVGTSITAVAATPIASGDAASQAAADATKAVHGAATVQDAWPTLEASIKLCEGDPAHLAQLRVALNSVQESKATLQEKLSILNDALLGDGNQFKEEVVYLFYYTEIEKLMRSLNDRTDWNGGNSTAATVAASQRELLLDSESRVSQARGEVADLQYELAKLQEQQRQANAAMDQLQLLRKQAGLTKKQRDSDLARATDELNQAQADSDADPNNAAKKLQLQKAKAKKDAATAKATDATTKDSDAQTKLSDAQAQQNSASADKDSLSARIELAQSKLGNAQQNLEEMQRSAYRAALTESEAFAAARDQTPYLEAPALATSPDPVKRVIMRGYPDRNVILLRGKPDDVAATKRVIADLDAPAPQARLTLWSFEISAELGKGLLWFKNRADKLNRATALVDETLGVTRGQIAEATTELRESINEAVSLADTGPSTDTRCSDQLVMPPPGLLLSEQARWRRFGFYSPAVLIQAGVNMANAESFKNAALPDPAATTTIGEALMVLALSCSKNRQSVFHNFRQRTHAYGYSPASSMPAETEAASKNQKCPDGPLPCFAGTAQVLQIPSECCPKGKAPVTAPADQEKEQIKKSQHDLEERERKLEEARKAFEEEKKAVVKDCEKGQADCQEKLKRASLGLAAADACPDPKVDVDNGPHMGEVLPSVATEGLTDMQLEIVRALRAGAAKKLLHQMDDLQSLILTLEKDYEVLRGKGLRSGFPGSQVIACKVKVAEIESIYNRYNRLVNTRLQTLYPDNFTDFLLVPGRGDFVSRVKLQSKDIWETLAQTGPRVAAADEMLKRMMSRMEDDLDQIYVQPMLKDLRNKLAKEGLTVGIVQRTSVLATNRLKARVDPKGMYDLSVGEQQDLLAGIGQLASIYMTAQTGGALAAFGSLNSLNQKQEQRIYGVTTGSKFEVTPIFDPSGQALRFKFDYVSNSLIRNPKGTVDPTMPSIRHTINSEVQLSNLEIREISRYESNAKLGIPTRYYGGIPLLTDIPGLKPIPLIGWFVRRAGSNAEAQQSVIFGQTTIYPTIKSIVDLLQTGN